MMIRKQIVFQPNKAIQIPYNYQYDVMKNIYYCMSIADNTLSNSLHNNGYISETGHKYKLFNYTLLFSNAVFTKDNIMCNQNSTIKLILSGKKDIINKILKGFVNTKKIKINNEIIPLIDIQDDKKVYFKPIMLYNTFSPVVESTKDNNNKVKYLTPLENDYYKNLAENAKRKYKLIYDRDYEGTIFFEIDDIYRIKEKHIQIKKGKVKGYVYNIWIETSPDMQKVIYYLGLGQNSSTSCGCLNFIKGVDNYAQVL